jgi:cell division protease FtsH
MQVIDEEVARILHDAAEKSEQLLEQNHDKLLTITDALCEREEISDLDIAELIGPSRRQVVESNGSAKVIAPEEAAEEPAK